MPNYYTSKRKRKKQKALQTLFVILLALVFLALIGVLLYFIFRKPVNEIPTVTTTEYEEQTFSSDHEEVLSKAEIMAAMYDYEAAVDYVKSEVPDYESDPRLVQFIGDCAAKKSQLVKWADNTQITHVFFHTLIADNEKAWSSYKRDDYNQVMTTIPEFNKIIQTMYEEGYVLVHLSDIAKIVTAEDGSSQMTYQPIYLPKGKTPFVLSVDDVSYYEYMNNTGFATRLVIAEDGRITNEMDIYEEIGDSSNGSVPNLVRDENGAPVVKETVRGDLDVVPLLDRFIELHPDFSYRGAKGTVALTGYNGVLGYDTSEIAYGAGDPDWPSAYEYHNIHIEEDRIKAKAVADAMKAEGWKFASHTWGHMRMSNYVDQSTGAVNGERFYRDTEWWLREVVPIIGETDIIIFAFGADIGSWRGYKDTVDVGGKATETAFKYLKSKGFDYYCNVDSSKHAWVQLSKTEGGSGYLRQARRNLDGQLMFKAMVYEKFYKDDTTKQKDILSDLFDPKLIWDPTRPYPVPGVTYPEGADLSSVFH